MAGTTASATDAGDGAGLVVIRGAGDLASAVAYRLFRSGFSLVMLEVPQPTVIRRRVAFAEAVYEGTIEIEGLTARLAASAAQAHEIAGQGQVAVLVDPQGCCLESPETPGALSPAVVVDAILAKKNLGTHRGMAPLVIGLGPGFTAGQDVDVVVETNRGHFLGRALWQGAPAPNTGIPGEVHGFAAERVIRAPAAGTFQEIKAIGDQVQRGEVVAEVVTAGASHPVVALIPGVLRGLLRTGLSVHQGMKVGDVDPRGIRQHCFTISDKGLAIAGGVLEAILTWRHQQGDFGRAWRAVGETELGPSTQTAAVVLPSKWVAHRPRVQAWVSKLSAGQ